MVYVFIIVGILLFIVSLKSKSPNFVRKRWLTRVVAVFVILIGFYIEGEKVQTPSSQATVQNQPKAEDAVSPVPHSQIEPESIKVNESNVSEKSLGDLDVAEPIVLNVLNEGNLKVRVKQDTLADGTPRKIYEGDTCYVETIGKPRVKEVSVMFVPSKDINQNANTLIMLSGAMKAYCHGTSAQNSAFVKVFTGFIGGTTKNKTTSVGQCRVKLFKGSKEFPLYVVTFNAQG